MKLASLRYEDLMRLRAVVRRVHMKHYPLDHLTLENCDRIIETIGEQTAQRLIRKLIDGELADGKLAH
jgi:hypothetical protein